MKPVCPICGSHETAYFHKKQYYAYFRCPECKSLFLDPLPSEKKIADIYNSHYEFRVNPLAETRFRQQVISILNNVRTIDPAASTMLDIGTGYGSFVQIARDAGFKATGLEPAKNLYKKARKLTNHVLNEGYEKYFSRNPKSRFDVISLIHVIEHVRHPERTLRQVVSHIKRGGILFIETPNIDSHLFNTEQSRYTYLTPPDHIHLFSPYGLELILRTLDREIKITTTTYSYPEHFMGIARSIRRGQFGPHQERTERSHHAQLKPMTAKRKKLPEKPLPFIDRHIAPPLTPILNIGNKGSIMQMYVQVF